MELDEEIILETSLVLFTRTLRPRLFFPPFKYILSLTQRSISMLISFIRQFLFRQPRSTEGFLKTRGNLSFSFHVHPVLSCFVLKGEDTPLAR